MVFSHTLDSTSVAMGYLRSQVNLNFSDLPKPVLTFLEGSRNDMHISWSAPPEGVFKVNIDGSFKQ